VPDNKIYVIDLTASPPVQIGTVEAGKQPSGMAINRAGTLALVANRADDSVSMLSIEGKSVKLVGTVSVANPSTTPRGTESSQTRRWREMDSNSRSPSAPGHAAACISENARASTMTATTDSGPRPPAE
jgi:DNA-binding beta-propeller fold protein YncE